MIKILLDINIILDVLQQRKPHYENSAKIVSLCADHVVDGYVSVISFGTIHYVLSRFLGRHKSLTYLKKIRAVTMVAGIDAEVIDLALASAFPDFEDAIQYYSAIKNGIDYIITRNEKDFLHAKLPVMRPEEYLAML